MFSFLLNYLGYEYTTLAASVFRRKTGVQSPPLSHLVLMVKVEGELLLADVGFGDSFWLPLRFTGLQEHQEQQSGTYRIRKSGNDHICEEKIKIIVDETGHEEIAKVQFTSPEDPGFAKSRPAAQRPAARGPRPATAQRPGGPKAHRPAARRPSGPVAQS